MLVISRDTNAKLEQFSLILLTFSFVLPIRLMAMCMLGFIFINAFRAVAARSHLRDVQITRGQKKVVLMFVLYFLVYLVSLSWTYDWDQGISRVETRSNFLTLPLAFVVFKIRVAKISFILWSLVWAVTIALATCFGVAIVYGFLHNDFVTPFKYYNFGFWLGFHPGYLSMLILFSLLSILELWKTYRDFRLLIALLVLFQMFSVVFIGARIAIGLLFVIVILAVVDFSRAKAKVNAKRIQIAIFVVGILILAILLSKNTRARLLEANESLRDRVEIYTVAVDLIRERPLLGFGMGGDKILLAKEYARRGLRDAAEGMYNVHNQYLQTLLEVGLAGLVIFALLIYTMLNNFSNKRSLIVRILLFFMVFFLIESGLQRIQGIVPFTALSLIFSFLTDTSQTQRRLGTKIT